MILYLGRLLTRPQRCVLFVLNIFSNKIMNAIGVHNESSYKTENFICEHLKRSIVITQNDLSNSIDDKHFLNIDFLQNLLIFLIYFKYIAHSRNNYITRPFVAFILYKNKLKATKLRLMKLVF